MSSVEEQRYRVETGGQGRDRGTGGQGRDRGTGGGVHCITDGC